MFVKSDSVPADSLMEADIAIIGSGPAGLAVAREFAGTDVKIAILESGGLEFDDFAFALSEGDVAGLPYPDLSGVRLRVFGGTSAHWDGNVRPLERLDFVARPEIGRDGWPITLDDLEPYYSRAREFFGLAPNAFDVDYWRETNGKSWAFRGDDVISQAFHTVAEKNLNTGTYWRKLFERSGNIKIYVNATVLQFETNESAGRVRSLRVGKRNLEKFTVRASKFVLAAGGIENARLLLLNNSRQAEGLGNGYGLVGKYFQEHLTNPDFAHFFPTDPQLNLSFYKGGKFDWGWAWGILRLSDEMQRKHKLANIRFQLATVTNAFNENMESDGMVSLSKLSGRQTIFPNEDILHHFAKVIADIDNVGAAAYQRIVNHPNYPLREIDIVQIGEQLPNPDSQVRLGDKRDAFGQRRVVLDWRITERDNESVQTTADVLAKSIGASRIGRLTDRLSPGGFKDVPPKPHYHHIGTTRMSDDPRRGVVDKHARVHSLENLFIAGSSIFPTGGNANPTYTIVALAIRLADHLKQGLKP